MNSILTAAYFTSICYARYNWYLSVMSTLRKWLKTIQFVNNSITGMEFSPKTKIL